MSQLDPIRYTAWYHRSEALPSADIALLARHEKRVLQLEKAVCVPPAWGLVVVHRGKGGHVSVAHGLAGYQAGCRCQLCCEAELVRVRSIGRAQSQRWGVGELYGGQGELRLFSSKRPWTPEEIVLLLESPLGVRALGQQLGRSATSVQSARHFYRVRRAEHTAAQKLIENEDSADTR